MESFIIGVRCSQSIHYYQVSAKDEDTARKISFRYCHKKKEEDYNELAHKTFLVYIEQSISQELANFILEM
jgi:hypothetical protein